jgi:UDP-2,3-diacylglucosamine pyrophosphatase LpxH
VDLEGTKRHIVAISDVHLGTPGPTTWFQPHLHQPYLERLLRWVIDQADAVRELVLLGDVVDLWTYPVDAVPPTFADIVDAHPTLLGPDGLLAEVSAALDGAVSYVPGNHDMGLTHDDVALLAGVRLVDAVPYEPAPGVLLAHGHHDTLFNAPAAHGPWAPLPLGYFVTRAVATRWARDLPDGQTVSDLPYQGNPNGIDLGSLTKVASGLGARSIGATLVDYVAGACKVELDEPIVLPDGSTTTLAEARAVYADTWTRWADAAGGGVLGHAEALRATLADFDGTCLGWFAQRTVLRHDAQLMVMGHTHVPAVGLAQGFVRYVNSGFGCPSGPDLANEVHPQAVTFSVIDADDHTAAVWGVDLEDGCRPVPARPARITVASGQDRSCYVELDNSAGDGELELVVAATTSGNHVVPPPQRVEAGAVARFWLQDNPGASGSSGTATYRRIGGRAHGDEVTLAYACPMIGRNAASGTDRFTARAGDGPWLEGEVAPRGRPVFARFDLS